MIWIARVGCCLSRVPLPSASRAACAHAHPPSAPSLPLPPSSALRFLESFAHLQQQAFLRGAAFEPRQLELLALVLRADCVHAMGGEARRRAAAAGGRRGSVAFQPPPLRTQLAAAPPAPPLPAADVSYQAYSLLQGYLTRYPYASLARHADGEWQGRPFLVIDERAAWQPLEASA